MRRRHKLQILLVVCLVLGGGRAFAETAGETPAADTEAGRPKVGLVLGGGGALGFAHIGVLQVLEEQRIAIDYIGGTSMGAIIAGLYASGMAPTEIQQFLESLDWWEVMNDETPRQELFFRRKQDDQRFLAEFGLKGGRLRTGAGMAAGQKFNNLMQMMTLRSSNVTNFDALPIPYRAVATDIRAGKPKVLDSGNLATAMRASMAVPGAFTPVEIDGTLLVDGGVVDNIPVETVRAMGADVIIAVDVCASGADVSARDLSSISGILGQMYSVVQRPQQEQMLKLADVVIQPDMRGYSAGQFHAISEILPRGELAARGVTNQLAAYAVSKNAFDRFLKSQRRAAPTSIPIGAVVVRGSDRVDVRTIEGRIASRPGADFDANAVLRDLKWVYGIGEFEQVLFRVEPDGNGTNTLAYIVTEKSWGPTYFRYGLNLRSDFANDADWRMLFNITRMSMNQRGAEWRNEVEIGSSQMLLSEFFQPLHYDGVFFVAPRLVYNSELQDVYDGHDHIAQYDTRWQAATLFGGVQFRRYAELRFGPYWGHGKATVDTGSSDLPTFDDALAGWSGAVTVDRQDRTLFARKGYYLATTLDLARENMGSDRHFDKVTAHARQYWSVGDHTLAAAAHAGSALGDELPEYAQFRLGGPLMFSGLADSQFRGSYLGIASLGYRYRLHMLPPTLGRGVYATARTDVGNVWETERDVDASDVRVGGSLGFGLDTIMGPIYAGYGRAEGGFGRFYMSLGTAF